MASGLYTAGRAGIAKTINLEQSDISLMLIDTSLYTVDLDTHADQTDVPDAANLSEVVLTGKTIDGYVFRANDATFTAVTGTAAAVIMFHDTDTYETSTLIAYLDNATQFPVTVDGQDVTIVWDTGVYGIFEV